MARHPHSWLVIFALARLRFIEQKDIEKALLSEKIDDSISVLTVKYWGWDIRPNGKISC